VVAKVLLNVSTPKIFQDNPSIIFEVGILGFPPLSYGGPKNQQCLVLHGPIKIVVPYMQKDCMIINLNIII
jgi:hypothetical protein